MNYANIPDEMKVLPNWILYRIIAGSPNQIQYCQGAARFRRRALIIQCVSRATGRCEAT